jgi:hypothetical protein
MRIAEGSLLRLRRVLRWIPGVRRGFASLGRGCRNGIHCDRLASRRRHVIPAAGIRPGVRFGDKLMLGQIPAFAGMTVKMVTPALYPHSWAERDPAIQSHRQKLRCETSEAITKKLNPAASSDARGVHFTFDGLPRL